MRSSVSIFLPSLLGAVSSTPAPEVKRQNSLPPRGTTNLADQTVSRVYLCTDVGWDGTCGYQVQPLNECIVLTSPWLDSVSSFGPDEGTTCELFSTNDCGSYGCSSPGCGFAPEIYLSYPGLGDLSDQNFNDHMASFMCWAS